MAANSFGSQFVVTTFGESHGIAMGVVVDGCPAGVRWNQNILDSFLQRRRPGQSLSVSARQEPDKFELLSGVFEGQTLGTPIALVVYNQDARPQDYSAIAGHPRAGHADDVWKSKFGISDHRGGGRSSGRETISRVMAGAIAKMALNQKFSNLEVSAQVVKIESRNVQGPPYSDEVEKWLEQAKMEGQSYGGVIQLKIRNPVSGLGQPVFRKLKSDLAMGIMSLGAVNGVELGTGFDAASSRGTEFHSEAESMNYGGIRGGISTGEDIDLRVSVKPTSSLLDVAKKGRHDPFIGTRAAVVVEAMAWIILMDHVLLKQSDRISHIEA